jgi:hypothetical protein
VHNQLTLANFGFYFLAFTSDTKIGLNALFRAVIAINRPAEFLTMQQ